MHVTSLRFSNLLVASHSVVDPADGVIKPLMGLDYKPVTGLEDFKPEGNAEKAQALMAEAKSACPDVHARATGAGLTFDVADTDTNKKGATIWIDFREEERRY